MLFDGECGFCRAWIDRWRAQTGEAVQFEASQQMAPQFPEIAPAEFANSVLLILPTGAVFRGAEAVFQMLSIGGVNNSLVRVYRANPAFRAIAETSYRLVAQNRGSASALFRLLSRLRVPHRSKPRLNND